MAASTFQPKTFTRNDSDGKPVERVAYTVDDAVKYEFDGWVEKSTNTRSAAAAKPADATAR